MNNKEKFKFKSIAFNVAYVLAALAISYSFLTWHWVAGLIILLGFVVGLIYLNK